MLDICSHNPGLLDTWRLITVLLSLTSLIPDVWYMLSYPWPPWTWCFISVLISKTFWYLMYDICGHIPVCLDIWCIIAALISLNSFIPGVWYLNSYSWPPWYLASDICSHIPELLDTWFLIYVLTSLTSLIPGVWYQFSYPWLPWYLVSYNMFSYPWTSLYLVSDSYTHVSDFLYTWCLI